MGVCSNKEPKCEKQTKSDKNSLSDQKQQGPIEIDPDNKFKNMEEWPGII